MEWQATIQAVQPYIIGGVFLLLYVAEHLYPERKELIDYRHDVRNVVVGILNAALIFGIGFLFQKGMLWYGKWSWGLLNGVNLPKWLRYCIEVLLLDCAMYWWHRANHRWTWLWRFHRFHHEDTKLNSTSSLRFHAAELAISYVWRVLLFPFTGISIAGFALYSLLFSAVVIFHHSGIRIGRRLDHVLRVGIVTPMMHRIHHSVLKAEADSNYGSVLPWWDWMFGSYHKHSKGVLRFGIENKG